MPDLQHPGVVEVDVLHVPPVHGAAEQHLPDGRGQRDGDGLAGADGHAEEYACGRGARRDFWSFSKLRYSIYFLFHYFTKA